MSKEMKTSSTVVQPAIEIILKGLLAIFANPKRKQAAIGLLKRTHHQHKLEVKVTEIDASGTPKDISPHALKDPLKLTLTPPQGISFRNPNMTINRMKHPPTGDPTEDSFAWAVAIEGADFYRKEIGALKAGFKPFLIFDSGELYTSEISQTVLERKDPGASSFTDFGFVAVEIGVHIPLNQMGVKAVLTNGNDPRPIFESKPNTRYEIHIDRGPKHQPTGVVTDAEDYYLDKAIGGKLNDSGKIHFQSHPKKDKAGPEAACFLVFLGDSEPK
jgi:hypothetical protein